MTLSKGQTCDLKNPHSNKSKKGYNNLAGYFWKKETYTKTKEEKICKSKTHKSNGHCCVLVITSTRTSVRSHRS